MHFPTVGIKIRCHYRAVFLVPWGGGGWDWVHWVRWPLIGPLYQPRMMNVKQSVEWELVGKIEVLKENQPEWHFVHHNSHMTGPQLEPTLRSAQPWRPWTCNDRQRLHQTNRLCYDTADFGAVVTGKTLLLLPSIFVCKTGHSTVPIAIHLPYICLNQSQSYWAFGLFPPSGLVESRKHDVSETGFVSVLRWGGKTPTQ
jgi:hypothetical protein